ncbi:MAG: hypothetical protein ACFCD0_06360 [Gemmataceae bacterium]
MKQIGFSPEIEVKFNIPRSIPFRDVVMRLQQAFCDNLLSHYRKKGKKEALKIAEKESRPNPEIRTYLYYDTPQLDALKNAETIRQIYCTGRRRPFWVTCKVASLSEEGLSVLESDSLKFFEEQSATDLRRELRLTQKYPALEKVIEAETQHLKWLLIPLDVEVKLDLCGNFRELEFELETKENTGSVAKLRRHIEPIVVDAGFEPTRVLVPKYIRHMYCHHEHKEQVRRVLPDWIVSHLTELEE